ncbi:MAG: hypothetical protein R3A45_05565 [Bdellovibrionota bacterium]
MILLLTACGSENQKPQAEFSPNIAVQNPIEIARYIRFAFKLPKPLKIKQEIIFIKSANSLPAASSPVVQINRAPME